MRRTRKKRSAKISEAIFLGRKASYTFDVYPLGGDIPETAGVFILSRRKVDKAGRASHAASCIGETSSIAAELKKHKRSKCVKQNAGNVVCLLKDEDAKSRSTVMDDITEVRTFSCVRNVFEPTMLRKPHAHPKPDKNAFPAIPAVSADLPLKPKRRKRVFEAEAAETTPRRSETAANAPVANGKRAGTRRVAVKTKSAKAAGTKAKQPKTTTRAKRTAAKPRAGVQGGVDRDRGQHRLSKQKRAAAGGAKTRTAKRARTRKKAAA